MKQKKSTDELKTDAFSVCVPKYRKRLADIWCHTEIVEGNQAEATDSVPKMTHISCKSLRKSRRN